MTRSGINYRENFSHIAKLNIVHVLLSIAVNQDWPLFLLAAVLRTAAKFPDIFKVFYF